MSYRSTIGSAQGGDVILLSRNVYTSDLTPIAPLGASANVNILDNQGNMVTAASAVVTHVTNLNLPTHGGFAGYSLDFSITLPDTLVGTSEGIPYMAIMDFSLSTATNPLVLPTVQESFLLTSDSQSAQGPQSNVLIAPLPAFLVYNAPFKPNYKKIDVTLYFGNRSVNTYSDVYAQGTWVGGQFSLPLDTTNLGASLMPYAALWTIDGNQDIAPIFVVNPSIHLAMKELSNYVNKNGSDWNTRELTFIPQQLAAALFNGACAFNSESIATDFYMTNAMGAIRSLWIQYSAIWLLRTQVLNGIETDFTFTNSSVTLDVDRASKYQQHADSLESSLKDQIRPLKAALTKRGNNGGDGSVSATQLNVGAIAALGLSLSPVSKVGSMVNPLGWRSAMMNPALTIGNFL